MQMHEVEELCSAGTIASANTRLNEGWCLLAVVGEANGARYIFGRNQASQMKHAMKGAPVVTPVEE